MTETLRKDLYRRILRIRRVEESIADEYSKQEMRCPVHLSIGQEAPPVGISAHLTDADRIYSNHRCHAHYLAKGGDLKKMIAELHGRLTGCAKGKGGSMHLVDVEHGMMGASALVAGTIPLAVGAALAIQQQGRKDVAVTFFGDGASEEGIFFESLNFASLKKLPVIFACENNDSATYSFQKARQANLNIALRGKPFDIPSFQLDGNDVEKIYALSGEAVERARRGEGPTLFEFITRRWRDHVGPGWDYEVGHRPKDEVEEWIHRCPLKQLELTLLGENPLLESELKKMDEEIKEEIRQAFSFAMDSPLPPETELFTDIYA